MAHLFPRIDCWYLGFVSPGYKACWILQPVDVSPLAVAFYSDDCPCGRDAWWVGLRHEIAIVRGQGREGVYAEDRSPRILGVKIPSVYLLPRRDEYTRVYTTVYPRVHNSIHACTLPRSKYILCRARLYVYSLGIMPRIFSDWLELPVI